MDCLFMTLQLLQCYYRDMKDNIERGIPADRYHRIIHVDGYSFCYAIFLGKGEGESTVSLRPQHTHFGSTGSNVNYQSKQSVDIFICIIRYGYRILYPPETQSGNGNLAIYGLYVHLRSLKMAMAKLSIFDSQAIQAAKPLGSTEDPGH